MTTPPRQMGKQQRQHRIAAILSDIVVTSQSQLVELLAAEDVPATQATVSRDLDELGAVKVRIAGGDTMYAIPELPSDHHVPEDHLRRVLSDWVVDVKHARNLVVLRTPPGCAHVVASALDRTGVEGVLGTVAGDDTLIVVLAEDSDVQAIVAQICDLAGLGNTNETRLPSDRDRRADRQRS